MRTSAGLTLVELIVVMAVFATLIAMSSILFLRPQSSANLESTYQTLLADINHQREKAMMLDTSGESTALPYGIYFQSSSYTLFRGSAYSAGDTHNVLVTLPTGITLTNITFPSTSVIFATGSGEVVGFSSSNNTLVLTAGDTTLSQILTLNRYGTSR